MKTTIFVLLASLSVDAFAISISCINEATFETFEQTSTESYMVMNYKSQYGQKVTIIGDLNYKSKPFLVRVDDSVEFRSGPELKVTLLGGNGKSEQLSCGLKD